MNINILLLKQIAILSAIAGGALAVVSIIPYINVFSFTILMLFLSGGVLYYMKRNNMIGIFDLREGSIFGAVVGFVSFIAFSVVFVPLDIIFPDDKLFITLLYVDFTINWEFFPKLNVPLLSIKLK